MSIDATSAAAAAGGSKTTGSRQKLAENLDTFLLMLTTQMKHQDPLSPMDSNEFTNQLVQFAGVEQQISQNENLERLIGLQYNNQLLAGVNYVGKTVEYSSKDMVLQNGQASFRYVLPAASTGTTILIKNQDGATIRTMTGQSTAGPHEVTWDGKDDGGNQLTSGHFQVEIVSSDGEGKEMNVALAMRASVNGVTWDDAGILLTLGEDLALPLSDITSVRN